MNKLFIIGNLTRDPEMRSTSTGDSVCSFTVAVNRRRASNAEAGQPEADFFRVSAWRQLGENCNRYLAKGRKVAVVGSVRVSTYTAQDGTTRASLEVNADDVEFLSPRGEGEGGAGRPAEQSMSPSASGMSGGFVKVDDEELPF
ncbi:MAG: single-stranded DNA-binding protein [Clostridiales bacterium]|jgi:single-strand DNA-binding protein|nr:single-stranded DNA-binding protein [Clostridiales bacterium]